MEQEGGRAARRFETTALDHACRLARLDLDAQRKQLVGPFIQQLYGLIDTLDAVELGDTQPATAFDARWE